MARALDRAFSLKGSPSGPGSGLCREIHRRKRYVDARYHLGARCDSPSRSALRNGADGIKIFASSIESNGVVLLHEGIAKAVAKEAHRKHLVVFSHPSDIEGVQLTLDSGADILAHVTSIGGSWPYALSQRMLAAHMSLIPTLTLFDVEEQKGHASPEETRKVIGVAVSQLNAYGSMGGLILFGTGIGYIDHYDTAEEYQLMAYAGMSFAQILASLTTSPAQRFGYASHSDRIAPGMDADMAVLKSDPGADVAALSHVVSTIRDGQFIFGKP